MMNWQVVWEFLAKLDTLLGILGIVVGVVGTLVYNWWLRKRLLKQLSRIAPGESVAFILYVGGQSDPVPDVQAYLQNHKPEISKLILYKAPIDWQKDDPKVALKILEDMRDMVASYGSGHIGEIHFFPSGMLVYPIAIGAMLSNWCPITVYHKQAGSYLPLYRLTKEWMQSRRRTTRSGVKFQVIELASEGTNASPPTAILL